MGEDNDSLFDRLGGEGAVSAVVNDFYDLVQQDERVARFFSGVDMESLLGHQKIFLTVAFGGTAKYEGKNIREAHEELGLNEDDFNAVAEDLCQVLENVGIGAELIAEVTEVLEGVKGDVISSKKSAITVVYDLEPEHCELVQRQLQWVEQAVGSMEAAGTIIYDALFEGAGEGRKLFVSPKKATAFRFISQVHRFVQGSDDVAYLDEELYNMGMRHIAYISPAQCKKYMPLFINTIRKVIQGVLDEEWDDFSAEAWNKLLNYIGGMLLRNLTEFTGKVHLIRKSWSNITATSSTRGTKNRHETVAEEDQEDDEKSNANKISTGSAINFGESLYFNLGVMSPEIAALFKRSKNELAPMFGDGFAQLTVLISDPMLLNEELYILGIRHLKYGTTPENFPVFGQAVMVTLRSMLPRDWNWAHEDAWGWLWETCSTYLSNTIEQGHTNKQLIDETMDRLVGEDPGKLGSICHHRLFALSDDVQNYFYKPNTMVAYILERVLFILSSLSHDPVVISHEIRSLGMRHIKYNIPPAHFPLLGKSLVFTFSTVLEGFWTDEIENSWMSVFGFVMRCMTRAVNEGTNLVTKAMVHNSVEEMHSVLTQAPRGLRDMWLLEVNVSGEILSPLYWALYDGKVALAEFMLRDLLAIRADRESYYCGIQNLFKTHPGLIKNIAVLSPSLLTTLFDGLLWRSRITDGGYKRVNYFIRYVYGDPTDERYLDPYQTPLAELTRLGYAELFVHPVTQFIIALKWTSYMRWQFIREQLYFFTLIVLFFVGYAVVDFSDANSVKYDVAYYTRILIAVLNIIILLFRQIPHLVFQIQRHQIASISIGWCRVSIPISLSSPINMARLLIHVLLVISFVSDRHIVGSSIDAKDADHIRSWSTSLTAVLMSMIPFDWFFLSILLASYRVRMSNVMRDLFTSLLFSTCLIFGFSCAMVLSNIGGHESPHFEHAHESAAYLFSVFAGNFVFDLEEMTIPMQLFFVVYTLSVSLLLLNLTTALFTSNSHHLNEDLLGLTYLSRATRIIELETLTSLEKRQELWHANNFEQRIEFDEGDLGLNGCIQVSEPQCQHTKDNKVDDHIQRYSGEASRKLPWPMNALVVLTVDDKLEAMDSMLVGVLKSLRQLGKKPGGGMDASQLSGASEGGAD